jgi:hypothetical protein
MPVGNLEEIVILQLPLHSDQQLFGGKTPKVWGGRFPNVVGFGAVFGDREKQGPPAANSGNPEAYCRKRLVARCIQKTVRHIPFS